MASITAGSTSCTVQHSTGRVLRSPGQVLCSTHAIESACKEVAFTVKTVRGATAWPTGSSLGLPNRHVSHHTTYTCLTVQCAMFPPQAGHPSATPSQHNSHPSVIACTHLHSLASSGTRLPTLHHVAQSGPLGTSGPQVCNLTCLLTLQHWWCQRGRACSPPCYLLARTCSPDTACTCPRLSCCRSLVYTCTRSCSRRNQGGICWAGPVCLLGSALQGSMRPCWCCQQDLSCQSHRGYTCLGFCPGSRCQQGIWCRGPRTSLHLEV
jgi:hypothetical protein